MSPWLLPLADELAAKGVPSSWDLPSVASALAHVLGKQLPMVAARETAIRALKERLQHLWLEQEDQARQWVAKQKQHVSCIQASPSEELAQVLLAFVEWEVNHRIAKPLFSNWRAVVWRSKEPSDTWYALNDRIDVTHLQPWLREYAGCLTAQTGMGGTAAPSQQPHQELTARLDQALETLASETQSNIQALQEMLGARLANVEALTSEHTANLEALHGESTGLVEQFQELTSEVAASSAAVSKPDLQMLLENAILKDRCEQFKQQLEKAEAAAASKAHELKALWVESATYKERCEQLAGQLAKAEQRISQLQKRHANGSLVSPGPCGSLRAACSNDDQNLAEQLGYAFVDDDLASSILSRASWFSVKPDCFMVDALFRTRSCGIDFFMMGKDLMKGSQVLAADDETILEIVKTPTVCPSSEVVDLHAGRATLRVTPDHLVLVPNPHDELGTGIYVKAGSLTEGDLVMLDSGEPVALTGVEIQAIEGEVLKIVFEPDLPVAVFSCPPCILSKGYRKPPTRRSFTRKKANKATNQSGVEDDGRASIPNTAGAYTD